MALRISTSIVLALIVLLVTGCSINHPIAEDYGQYLANNQGGAQLPHAEVADKYVLPEATRSHHYEFRSAMVGYANLWVVEIAKILDETMASPDVVAALGKLVKAGDQDMAQGDTLVFALQDYTFAEFGAHVTLDIAVKRDGTDRFRKTYQATGITQGGKMFWGGVFGMKNAIQQSTKSALDQILAEFLNDVRQALPDTAG